MSTITVLTRLTYKTETEKAFGFDNFNDDGELFWLPKSLVKILSGKTMDSEAWVSMPRWIAEQNDLDF